MTKWPWMMMTWRFLWVESRSKKRVEQTGWTWYFVLSQSPLFLWCDSLEDWLVAQKRGGVEKRKTETVRCSAAEFVRSTSQRNRKKKKKIFLVQKQRAGTHRTRRIRCPSCYHSCSSSPINATETKHSHRLDKQPFPYSSFFFCYQYKKAWAAVSFPFFFTFPNNSNNRSNKQLFLNKQHNPTQPTLPTTVHSTHPFSSQWCPSSAHPSPRPPLPVTSPPQHPPGLPLSPLATLKPWPSPPQGPRLSPTLFSAALLSSPVLPTSSRTRSSTGPQMLASRSIALDLPNFLLYAWNVFHSRSLFFCPFQPHTCTWKTNPTLVLSPSPRRNRPYTQSSLFLFLLPV